MQRASGHLGIKERAVMRNTSVGRAVRLAASGPQVVTSLVAQRNSVWVSECDGCFHSADGGVHSAVFIVQAAIDDGEHGGSEAHECSGPLLLASCGVAQHQCRACSQQLCVLRGEPPRALDDALGRQSLDGGRRRGSGSESSTANAGTTGMAGSLRAVIALPLQCCSAAAGAEWLGRAGCGRGSLSLGHA